MDKVKGTEALVGWSVLVRWLQVVAGEGEAEVGALSQWAAEARVQVESDETTRREEWVKFAELAVKEGGKKAHR